jgi:hypothetical protein
LLASCSCAIPALWPQHLRRKHRKNQWGKRGRSRGPSTDLGKKASAEQAKARLRASSEQRKPCGASGSARFSAPAARNVLGRDLAVEHEPQQDNNRAICAIGGPSAQSICGDSVAAPEVASTA